MAEVRNLNARRWRAMRESDRRISDQRQPIARKAPFGAGLTLGAETPNPCLIFVECFLPKEIVAMAKITGADAVAQLAAARTKAETSVAILKRFGDSGSLARGQLIYSDAKAEADAVIAGLIVAFSAKGQPEKLSSLQDRVEHAVTGLAKLRNLAERQLPKLEGTKEFSDILKGAIGELQKPLSDVVSALYNNYRADDELTRKTIQTQLEAARWLDFAEVKEA